MLIFFKHCQCMLVNMPTFAYAAQEAEAFETMYENSGILSTEDGTLSALAGSTVGGGTRINWWVVLCCAALRCAVQCWAGMGYAGTSELSCEGE